MTNQVQATAPADGTQNYWDVILILAPHCKNLSCILDWFHIAMQFQRIRGVGDGFKETLAGWHGKSDEALQKLELLMTNISDFKKCSKLKKLYNYLVNHQEHNQQDLSDTSPVIISDRYKHMKKMQSTHNGSHNVLQI